MLILPAKCHGQHLTVGLFFVASRMLGGNETTWDSVGSEIEEALLDEKRAELLSQSGRILFKTVESRSGIFIKTKECDCHEQIYETVFAITAA